MPGCPPAVLSVVNLTNQSLTLLELEAHSKLEGAWRVATSIQINCPEGWVSNRRIRVPEAGTIEEVEHLGPHVQFHAFFGHKRFVDIHIKVVDAVDAKIGEVARSIAFPPERSRPVIGLDRWLPLV